MFIRRGNESNGTVKMTMIIPRKETQAIGLSRPKGFKSTRIGRMTLQGREEGFNKGVIRGGTGSSNCLLYTSPSPRDRTRSRMPSSA